MSRLMKPRSLNDAQRALYLRVAATPTWKTRPTPKTSRSTGPTRPFRPHPPIRTPVHRSRPFALSLSKGGRSMDHACRRAGSQRDLWMTRLAAAWLLFGAGVCAFLATAALR
jgi:hypothetical protein